MTPARDTSPKVGLMPAMPQSDAGARIDPPVSVPNAAGTMPAATAAPEPLNEPPVKCSRCHGLRAGGQGRSNAGPPIANSCVESLPSRTAPAAPSFLTAVASVVGTRFTQILECADVRMPCVS